MIKVTGLDGTLKQLKAARRKMPALKKRFMERLADVGIETASIGFKSAQYDGDNDVVVDKAEWQDDNTLVLSAKGEAVAFIEFGTGVTYTETHPWASEVGAVRGAYGQGKGSRSSWGYYGNPGSNGEIKRIDLVKGDLVITKGNPASMSMYEAYKEMQDRAFEIAKEVYGFD